MKRIKIVFFLTVLFACFFVCSQSAYAAVITSAKYENNRITLSGTGDTQVQIVLFDLNNSPLYMTTAPVENGTFSITLPEIAGLQNGNYTVKVADYDGQNVASKVITVSNNVGSDTVYDATKGGDGTWTKGSTGEYSFTFDGPLSKFSTLQMDGKTVDKSNYIAQSGSTIITFKPDYLKTLSVGKHTLRVLYTDGYAQAAFTIAAWQNTFTDVAETDWFYDDVCYAASSGLMQGTGGAAFVPHGATTRAMLASMLYRLEGEPAIMFVRAPDKAFSDVAEGAWYEKAVQWAQLNGIVEGYDGKFYPNAPLTREQMAAILYRYAQLKGYDVSVGEDTNILSYNDAFSISEYAIPAMQWACGAGLIQGSDGNLLPCGNAARAQVAAVMHRFCKNVK